MHGADQVGALAHHRHLGHGADQQVDSAEEMGEGGGVGGGRLGQEADDVLGGFLVAGLAGERGEAGQGLGGGAVGRRGGAVEHVLLAGDERLGVVAGGEHPALLVVPEPVEQGVGGGSGLADPAGLAGALGQPGEAVDQGGVVGGVGQRPGADLVGGPVVEVGVPRAQPPSVVPPQVGQEELAQRRRRVPPVGVAGGGRRLGQGGQEQPVPLGQHLVVEARAHPVLPRLEQRPAGPLDRRRADEVAPHRAVHDVGALEVAAGGDAVPLDGGLRVVATDLADLLRAPDVELPLLALGVGVLGRPAPSARGTQVPQHVADGLVEHLAVPLLAGDLPGVKVDPGEQGLVVEHLLEVGDHPEGVDGVAGEGAAHVVVDAARGHGVERRGHHVEFGVVRLAVVQPQEQLVGHGLGELGCPAETTPLTVELGPQGVRCRIEDLGAGERSLAGEQGRLAQRLGQAAGLLVDLVPPGAPGVVHRLAQRDEPGHPRPGLLGEVGAAEERATVGGQEHRHGPAAVSGHGLDGVHVDGVDIGAFLAVDLHVDEQLVDDLGGLRVLERLVGHDVAPMAGGVAHREQHRDVAAAGLGERLLPPGVPVDRVLPVLAQVRAGGIGEAVHPSTLPSVVPGRAEAASSARRSLPRAVRGRASTTTSSRGAA